MAAQRKKSASTTASAREGRGAPRETRVAAGGEKPRSRRTTAKPAEVLATLSQWTFLNEAWTQRGNGFESPLKRRSGAQTLIFNDTVKDGTVTANVTLQKHLGERWPGREANEANVIVRFVAEDRFYYAGLGAWGHKFHISKAISGPTWLRLAGVGGAEALDMNHTYRLRVECQGSQIVLFENDTKVLEAEDKDYGTGRWGLSTFKTQARFEPKAPARSALRCFVIMPFAPEFDGVYELIESVLESYENVECTRADQLAVSRPIMEDVRNEIARADIVIVDLTGRNPNVYYEAGMAAAWGKAWIVIAQANQDLTFDVEQVRFILYANRIGAAEQFEDRLRRAIEETLGNPKRAKNE